MRVHVRSHCFQLPEAGNGTATAKMQNNAPSSILLPTIPIISTGHSYAGALLVGAP